MNTQDTSQNSDFQLLIKGLDKNVDCEIQIPKVTSVSERVVQEDFARQRDDTTAQIYKAYNQSFIDHNKFKNRYKRILFWSCMAIMIALTVAIIVCISKVFSSENISTANILAYLIPSCVTYLTSILGIINIIARHLFPTDEMEHINDMVKAIMASDSENKRFNKEHEK